MSQIKKEVQQAFINATKKVLKIEKDLDIYDVIDILKNLNERKSKLAGDIALLGLSHLNKNNI